MKILVIFTFVIILVIVDKVFLPKSARNAWMLMTFTYLIGAFIIVENRIIDSVAAALGIGRPIDIILYFVVILFVRDLFMSRYRFQILQKQITDLARAEAIKNARVFKFTDISSMMKR